MTSKIKKNSLLLVVPVPHLLAGDADLEERLRVELEGGQPAPLPAISKLFATNHAKRGATGRIFLSEKSF